MTPEPIQNIDLTQLALPLGREWFLVSYVGGNKVRLTAAWPDGERASLP